METVGQLAAEIVLCTVAVVIYMGGAFYETRTVWRWFALAGVGAAAVALLLFPGEASPDSPLVPDAAAYYARWLSLAVGLLLLLTAWRPLDSEGTSEYLGSLLLLTSGLLIASAARDLVLTFVGLELVSIPTYILLYLGRRSRLSQEASAKYFYLSILSSAVFLYGLSFVYGAAASTDLTAIGRRFASPGADGFGTFAKLGMLLIFGGLGFRIAAVPFHFYAPDVFQGTTNANAALLSVAPKIAGFTVLIRIVGTSLPTTHSSAWIVALVLAALTMTLGNVSALWQDNLRRMMAYSSIANAGYLLIGFAAFLASPQHAAGPNDGVGALWMYLTVYAFGTIGVFACLACLGRRERRVEGIDDLAGLAWMPGEGRPTLAWVLAILLLSLTGIPPLAGFWGKLMLFSGALSLDGPVPDARAWFVALAILGVLNSAISAGYYLRIIGVMFFRAPLAAVPVREDSRGMFTAALACVLAVLIVGVYPKPWIRSAYRASPRVASGAPTLVPDDARSDSPVRPGVAERATGSG